MLLVEGFQKFAGIPFGISRIFESLMPQQISANRRKNRSIQVKYVQPNQVCNTLVVQIFTFIFQPKIQPLVY